MAWSKRGSGDLDGQMHGDAATLYILIALQEELYIIRDSVGLN